MKNRFFYKMDTDEQLYHLRSFYFNLGINLFIGGMIIYNLFQINTNLKNLHNSFEDTFP